MNDRMKPPGTGSGPPQATLHLNLNDMPPVGCPNCGCQVFATSVCMLRKLGATQSPIGKAMLARIPLELCQGCDALYQVVGDELKLVELVPIGKEDTDGEA